jgi:hypothetical protein
MMRSTLQIEFASKPIADQHYHLEAVGVVGAALVHDYGLPSIALRRTEMATSVGKSEICSNSTRMAASSSAAVLLGLFIPRAPAA